MTIFRSIATEQGIENRIIRRVLSRAEAAGYKIVRTAFTYDNTDAVQTDTADAVIAAFRVRDADVIVRLEPKPDTVGIKRGWIRFIGGNGEDVFADYGTSLLPVFDGWDPSGQEQDAAFFGEA